MYTQMTSAEALMSILSVVLVIHVLAATFWAGSTFTLARTRGESAAVLFGPQMGAAVVAIAAGGYLWRQLFGDGPGHAVIGVGSLAAVVAAILQAVLVGRVRRRIDTDPAARSRALLGHRIAAGLFVVTIACMVVQ
jgi:hypothetical protein